MNKIDPLKDCFSVYQRISYITLGEKLNPGENNIIYFEN